MLCTEFISPAPPNGPMLAELCDIRDLPFPGDHGARPHPSPCPCCAGTSFPGWKLAASQQPRCSEDVRGPAHPLFCDYPRGTAGPLRVPLPVPRCSFSTAAVDCLSQEEQCPVTAESHRMGGASDLGEERVRLLPSPSEATEARGLGFLTRLGRGSPRSHVQALGLQARCLSSACEAPHL